MRECRAETLLTLLFWEGTGFIHVCSLENKSMNICSLFKSGLNLLGAKNIVKRFASSSSKWYPYLALGHVYIFFDLCVYNYLL